MSNKSEVLDYFKNKAEEYDLVDHQVYWRLSDTILWEILNEHALSRLDSSFKFVDIGGGTGRWSLKVLENYNQSQGLMIDLSKDMLQQARNKFDQSADYKSRIQLVEADLDYYEGSENEFDVAFTFHNVLGFVNSPQNVIGKMSKMVKPGGYIIAVVPNYYHNIFFNISNNNMDLAIETVTTNKGRFTSDMPAMNMFTPNGLTQTYDSLGIETVGLYGFPVAIYPGYQETQLKGETRKLQEILQNKETYEQILRMELELYKNSEAASRGNQIFIIGQKK